MRGNPALSYKPDTAADSVSAAASPEYEQISIDMCKGQAIFEYIHCFHAMEKIKDSPQRRKDAEEKWIKE